MTENPVRIMGYVTARKQVDAQALLDSIQAYKHRHGIPEPVLLVVHQDLFRNGNSFVFGLARESVGAGVVSTSRLGNEYYGLPGNDDDYIDRIAKEGAHEIGHLLGLPHCNDRECVMFRPDTLDELDRKKKVLCPTCREQSGYAAGREIVAWSFPPARQVPGLTELHMVSGENLFAIAITAITISLFCLYNYTVSQPASHLSHTSPCCPRISCCSNGTFRIPCPGVNVTD